MSLSGALSNAMSGLTANARATTVVSSNVANALNETYGRREVDLSTNATQTAGGVVVTQVTRHSNPVLAHQKRLGQADLSAASEHARFQTRLEHLVGSLDTGGSLAGKLTHLETALLSAASNPSSQTGLRNVSFAADAFASGLRAASDGIDALRSEADARIGQAVADMNAQLHQLERLNAQVMTARHLGQDVNGVLDRRDAVLETLSQFVPLHVVERDSGAIAVFTAQGRTLLDEHAVELGFTPSATVTPHMSLGNGLLSQLSVAGKTVEIPGSGLMNGGLLEALFQTRDVTAPQAQTRLDAIARDVIDRFGPGGPDPTLAPGDAGVFTDAGAVFDPVNTTGIAGRISLNGVLSPAGSEVWRWRAGVQASQPGDVGQNALLAKLHAEFDTTRIASSPVLGTHAQSLTTHLHSLSNDVAADRIRLVDAQDTAANHVNELRQTSAAQGVNTDQELQKLIELEKSYAANARVVQVVDDMLSELLRI